MQLFTWRFESPSRLQQPILGYPQGYQPFQGLGSRGPRWAPASRECPERCLQAGARGRCPGVLCTCSAAAPSRAAEA